MSKRILIPIATGCEEMEAITVIDMMVRAGYQVVVASANLDGQLMMKASRGVTLTADCKLLDVIDEEFDVIALPGGVGGAEIFRDNPVLIEMLKQQHNHGRWLAAICATPALVLQHHQLFPQAIMTGHPAFRDHIPTDLWRDQRVTIDTHHQLITSQGPGTALEFAMEIIISLSGKAHAWSVAQPMVTLAALNYHKLGEQ